MDDRTIKRIIAPPRDEAGRLRIRPKREQEAPRGFAAFVKKWGDGYGIARHHLEALWRSGIRH